MDIIFNEMFISGIVDKSRDKRALCADALCAWGCCMAGSKVPDKFGIAMVEIGLILDISPTPDEFMKYAKGINKSKL